MTEEPTMKLYAFSVAAIQPGERSAIGVQTALVTLPEGASVDDAGMFVARDIFPESDGWEQHYANAMEIVQGFPLAPYQLTWHLEKVQ